MIIEYEEKYLDDVRDLLVELEEYIVSIDKDKLDTIHPEYKGKMAIVDLEELEKNEGKCYLYIENGKALALIMGCVRQYDKYDYLDYKCPKSGNITELIVSQNLRSKGIGQELINKMEEYFKSINCEYILVDVFAYNENAFNFYSKKDYHSRMHTMIKKIEPAMITITTYQDNYAEAMSRIITQNLMEINSKDYGIEFCKNSAKDFTPEKIKEDFNKRTKVFVALENDIVVGTAGLDKSWYNDDGEYYILSVFVDVSHHKQGIGKMLMQKVEEFAKEINAKKLVIPASIAGAEFYHKLGYEYANGKKELNEHQMYTMEKYL